jgi:PAS domain S-box-containing protein
LSDGGVEEPRANGRAGAWLRRRFSLSSLAVRTYFLGALLLVAIAPLILLSSIDLWSTTGKAESEARDRLADTAFHIAAHIDAYIEQHASAVSSCSFALGGLAKTPSQMERTLQAHHAAFDGFITMLAADREGNVVAASPAGLAARGATNVADRDYFRTPLQTGRSFTSEVFRGRGFGTDPIVALSAPWRDADGRILGVVEGSLNLNKLSRLASHAGGRGEIRVLIVDRHDRVVFSDADCYRFLQPLGRTELVRRARESAAPAFRDRESDVVAGRGNTRNGWMAIASQPWPTVRREAWLRGRRTLAWLGVLIVVSFALARLTAARVTRPLSRLVAAVRALQAGDAVEPTARAFQGAPVEILELAEGFDDMSERLSASYRDLERVNRNLERRVGERTAELFAVNRALADQIAEKNAAQSTLVLRDRAIAAASDGVVITEMSPAGPRVVYANPGSERLTGFSAQELGEGCWNRLHGPDTDPEALAAIAAAFRDGAHCSVEMINYRKNRARFWMRLSLNPVRDERGRVTHFIGVQSDITHRKQIEKLKNDLVSTVSHELRTPLTSLRGFAELLREREYPREKQRRFLDIIVREATRLGGLVSDFLDLQRIETGRELFHFQPADLAALIAETRAVFAAHSARHRLSIEIPHPLPQARMDPDRIRQVLANLVSNAIKFSPEGGPVTIGAHAADGRLVCWVRDRGIGIGPESIAKLFTRFFRVDNTETRRIGGAGLGLELVKRLVEAHQGEVWVESALGQGSTFFFALPVETPLAPAPEERREEATTRPPDAA